MLSLLGDDHYEHPEGWYGLYEGKAIVLSKLVLLSLFSKILMRSRYPSILNESYGFASTKCRSFTSE